MSTLKILIVEDEPLVALAVQLDLEQSGYTVCGIVASAERAVQQVEQQQPELILMDINLHNDMDGIEAAKQIVARFGTPIIYMTGYNNPQVHQQAEATHPLAYLLKPIDFQELNIIIKMTFCKGG